ncbi:SnoaL-like polyketide cyclase [Pacificibacter maritimus]|uniref:SnoaL-like polyketide cyclase n=1 Tax=Pacificibacter maritimus TaxID=762213 RepID=A0A3N4ULX9_9RHOB|nr:ester cyclase [Pacificibacter maritimus]RPE71572.1 SnoaL-like polyketide cyclase [Pacificibacter maritimus]
MTGIELLTLWYKRVWEQGDLTAVAEYFDVEAKANGLMSNLAAELEDFKTIVPAIQKSVRNITVSIDRSMEVDDQAWALVTIAAQNAKTMDPVTCSGQVIIRVRDEKIIEAHNHFDFIGLFEQLGCLPQDTIALCLSGETLT